MRAFLAVFFVVLFACSAIAQGQLPYWNDAFPGGVSGLYQNRTVSGPPVPLPVSSMTIEIGLKLISASRTTAFDNGVVSLNFSDFPGYPKDTRLWEFEAAARERMGFEARYAYLTRQEDKFVVPGSLLSNFNFGGVSFGQGGGGAAASSSNKDLQFTTRTSRHRISLLVPVGFELSIRPALDVRAWSFSADADTVLTSNTSAQDQKHGSETWARGSIGPAIFIERPVGSWTIVADGAWYIQDKGYTIQVGAKYKPMFPGPLPIIKVGYWAESFNIGSVRQVIQGPEISVDLSF